MSQPVHGEPNRSHKEILEVLAGLLAMLFVAMVSSTIVSTALPTIIGDLRGNQTQYTWVVTTTLLAMTVSSPIWSSSEEHTSELQSLMRISYDAFCLKKKNTTSYTYDRENYNNRT